MLKPENHRWFTLDIIRAETARTEAARNIDHGDEVVAESM